MGTEVLRPQDCLNQGLGIPIGFSRRRCAYQAGNPPRQARKPTDLATHQKKQPPKKPVGDAGKHPGRKAAAKNPVTGMGQVAILKRGQSLDSVKDRRPLPPPVAGTTSGGFPGDLIIVRTHRLGPDPSLVRRQIGLAGSSLPKYAGPGFSTSPCPSSLPLPSFSVKKCFEDSATKDLRRLLRID